MDAEFFDIFGVIGFAILLYIGMRIRKKKKVRPWISTIIIAIATLGLLVDLYIVFQAFVFG